MHAKYKLVSMRGDALTEQRDIEGAMSQHHHRLIVLVLEKLRDNLALPTEFKVVISTEFRSSMWYVGSRHVNDFTHHNAGEVPHDDSHNVVHIVDDPLLNACTCGCRRLTQKAEYDKVYRVYYLTCDECGNEVHSRNLDRLFKNWNKANITEVQVEKNKRLKNLRHRRYIEFGKAHPTK